MLIIFHKAYPELTYAERMDLMSVSARAHYLNDNSLSLV